MISLNICFIELSEDFTEETSSNTVNEISVFESLKFYCNYVKQIQHTNMK